MNSETILRGVLDPAGREMISAAPQSVCRPLYTKPPRRRWSWGNAVLIG
jgi:hypothetical protein